MSDAIWSIFSCLPNNYSDEKMRPKQTFDAIAGLSMSMLVK